MTPTSLLLITSIQFATAPVCEDVYDQTIHCPALDQTPLQTQGEPLPENGADPTWPKPASSDELLDFNTIGWGFMVGSGMSYHNMQNFMGSMRGAPTSIADDSKAFDQWLAESMQLDASTRATRLIEWEKAPAARACHPREEHLLPLMVIAGAAGNDPGSLPYQDVVMNAHVSAVHFG